MRRILEAYGQHMEFCQIQLNWLDWTFQNAKEKVDLLNQYHIPVWVMEPLRDGALTKLLKDNENSGVNAQNFDRVEISRELSIVDAQYETTKAERGPEATDPLFIYKYQMLGIKGCVPNSV